jgi:S-DNA-T family DNA segregation ATPase FtsK/SpoIIIE
VLEGEVVASPRHPVARVVRVVVVVVRHEHVQRGGRHMAYIPLGAYVVGRRIWDARTTARFERYIRASEAGGDHESMVRWEELRQKFLNDRHKRRMERRHSTLEAFRAAPFIAGGTVGVLGSIGIFMAIAEHRFGEIAVPFVAVAHLVMLVILVVSVSWGPFVIGAPWIGLAMLWWIGKRHAQGMTGGWLAAAQPDGEDGGMVVTADTIVLALQHMPVPALKTAFKDGWIPQFTTTPVRDGQGYEAEFSVPLGVTAEQIADANKVLARNLHRDEHESWPSAGPPGYVKLWVADRGALNRAAPEYPLLHSGTADVFKGVPGGVTARGDEIVAPVVGNNGVLGGMMGQGKSNAARVLMLGCATDPICSLDAWVFANNGDFDAYAPRLARYEKGLDDDVIAAAVERLHELYRWVGEREEMLADLGAKKVSRELAQQYPELRQHVALFSECHELFGHKEDGKLSDMAKMAAELVIKTIKRARKTGIVLWFDTQSSRKEAIPPALVELVSVNCCFAVKTWRSNDGFLGDGSFQRGIRATELRPGRDRGTSLVTGVSDAQFELLKWYFVAVDDDTGFDAAADVIKRCMQRVDPRTPVASSTPVAIEARDLLTDLDAVLGSERARLADVPALLRDLAPHWPAYRTGALNGVRLRELLDKEGVRVKTTGGILWLDPPDVRDVLRQRSELDD